ncbi:MAG: type II secretion system F family protein [Thermoguttaceae bacterium]
MLYAVIALAFGAGFLIVFGVNLLLVDAMESHRMRVRKRLEDELRLHQKNMAQSSLEFRELYELAAEGTVELNPGRTATERFAHFVHESGLQIKPQQVLGLCLVTAAAADGLAWLLTNHWAATATVKWIVTAVAALIAGVLPTIYVSGVRSRRREKLLSQLPDAFDLMARTMKAGQTIPQALQAVGDELSRPVADEFSYCYEQQNLGLSVEATVRDLARRTGLLEIKIFVLAVMIHRQTGGNLADLLGKLAHVIRERYRIRGAIRTVTAEGRMQAVVLLALPPVMLGVLLYMNRPYALVLFQYPALLAATFGSMAFGAWWMHKIVNFDF